MYIRQASPADIPAIVALVNSAYRGDQSKQGWTTEADLLAGSLRTDEANLAEMLAKPGATMFCCFDRAEGQLVGCVYLHLQDRGMYLGMLTAAPDKQGAGIGKKLVEVAEAHAQEQGAGNIFFRVFSVRDELIAWYERKGYRPTGERIPYDVPTRFGVPTRPLEFIVMKKDIQPPKHVLVFATNNAHKAQEVEQILGPRFTVKTLRDIGCHEDIAETADTLEGNAQIKARYVREHYGYDCFSEDTGLEVAALNGAPGVITARYAGEGRNADDNINLLLKNLAPHNDRSARFRTIICLIIKGEEHLFEGICPGTMAPAKRGTGGFGYDPIFVPDGYEQTFAELGEPIKNEISHRGRATKKLMEFLRLD